jgi:hypothetical protein
VKSIGLTFTLFLLVSIAIANFQIPSSFSQEKVPNQTNYGDSKQEHSPSDSQFLENASLNAYNLAIIVERRSYSDVDRLSRNIFTIEDVLSLCAIVSSNNNDPTPVPVTVTVSKIGEYGKEKPVFSSSKYINQNRDPSDPFCYEDSSFELFGIISSGDYVVKAQINGTGTYAQSLFQVNDAWYTYLTHDMLTLQNAKIAIAILAFFIMIGFVIFTVIKGHPPSFGLIKYDGKDHEDYSFELELKGIILMSIMVFSIISFLGNVTQPIGSNTSFGIVKDAEIDMSRFTAEGTEKIGDLVGKVNPDGKEEVKSTLTKDTNVNTSKIVEDIKQNVEDIKQNVEDILNIKDTGQNIEEQWVLNLGGIEKIVCVESKGIPSDQALSYFKNKNPCYRPEKNLVPYSVVEGGVQIPLYVLILALIGGYLRYLYNIATTQLKKHPKESNAEEKKRMLNKSMQNFVQEFLYILLSPIVAIALWLFLRQGGIESSLSLALSSITVGLVLKNVIETLESWAQNQLRNKGKDEEGKDEEGKDEEGKDEEGKDEEGKDEEGKVDLNNTLEIHKHDKRKNSK